MKSYKYFLLVTTIVSSLVPFTLSAASKVSSDELAQEIERCRVACRTPKAIESNGNGWFSSVRKSVGNAMRWAGDQMRTEDTRTGAGKLKEAAKEYAVSAASVRTGLPIKTSIFNSVGNAARWAGQRVKGGEETLSVTRTVVNNLGLNKSAKVSDIEEALKFAATSIIKADVGSTAPEDYFKVVNTLNNRGHSTKSIDTLGIYVEALVLDKVKKTPTGTFAEFANSFKNNELEAIKNVLPVKMASTVAKRQAMVDYLRAAYDKTKAKVALES